MSDKDGATVGAACAGCLFIILLVLGFSAGFGWLLMTILAAAFKIHFSFWLCWGIWIFVSALFAKLKD